MLLASQGQTEMLYIASRALLCQSVTISISLSTKVNLSLLYAKATTLNHVNILQ